MTDWPESRQLAAQYQSSGITGIGFARYASTGTVTPELWENIRTTESLAESNEGKPAVEGWAEDMKRLRHLLDVEGITETRKVRLELSWTEQVNRTTIVEVEVTDDEMDDIESGYGTTEPRWVKEVEKQHPGAEIMHNEMDHIEVLEPEDTEGTKLIRASWYRTETFEREFRVSEDFDLDEDDEELMDQINNLDQEELTESFEGCTDLVVTEVTPIEEAP